MSEGEKDIAKLCVKIFEAIEINYKMINNLHEKLSIVSEKIDPLSKKTDLHNEKV